MGTEVRAAVSRRGSADRPAAVRALSIAFDDDPVIRWLLPDGRSLEPFFRTLLATSHTTTMTDLCVRDGEVVGASVWDPPRWSPGLRRQLLSKPMFVAAMGRYVLRGATTDALLTKHRPRVPFTYLAYLGATSPGQGIGSALLERRLEGLAGPAYLESSNVRNVPLYERHGFEVTGEIVLPDGPTLWTMWRP